MDFGARKAGRKIALFCTLCGTAYNHDVAAGQLAVFQGATRPQRFAWAGRRASAAADVPSLRPAAAHLRQHNGKTHVPGEVVPEGLDESSPARSAGLTF
jgi:hypothetical protein